MAQGTGRPATLPPVLRRSLDRLGQPRRGIREDSRAQDSAGEPTDHGAADSGRRGGRGGRGSISLAPGWRTRLWPPWTGGLPSKQRYRRQGSRAKIPAMARNTAHFYRFALDDKSTDFADMGTSAQPAPA